MIVAARLRALVCGILGGFSAFGLFGCIVWQLASLKRLQSREEIVFKEYLLLYFKRPFQVHSVLCLDLIEFVRFLHESLECLLLRRLPAL